MARLRATFYVLMKKLLLIRHSKSDWGNPELNDFDRPLNKRGHKNAAEMADRLLKKNMVPELIIASPALRALTTAEYFADALSLGQSAIVKEADIYEASSSTLLGIVNTIDDHYKYAALIGHNPGLTNFAVNLCNCDIYNMPTTGMILIHFPFDSWKLISYWTGEQQFYDYPKNTEG